MKTPKWPPVIPQDMEKDDSSPIDGGIFLEAILLLVIFALVLTMGLLIINAL